MLLIPLQVCIHKRTVADNLASSNKKKTIKVRGMEHHRNNKRNQETIMIKCKSLISINFNLKNLVLKLPKLLRNLTKPIQKKDTQLSKELTQLSLPKLCKAN
jgi:hypothetical protein